VEQADRLQFVAGFQAGAQHPGLDRQCRQQQHVVARQAEDARARHQRHRREEQSCEQAGARFLDAEGEEFGAGPAPAVQRACAGVDQARVEGGQHAAGDARRLRSGGRAHRAASGAGTGAAARVEKAALGRIG